MNLMSLLWNKLRKKIITDWLLRIMCVHIYSKDHKTREADIFICVAIKLSDFVFNFYISASLLHVMSCQNAKTKCRSFLKSWIERTFPLCIYLVKILSESRLKKIEN